MKSVNSPEYIYYLDIKFDEYLISIACTVSGDNTAKPFVWVYTRKKEPPAGFADFVVETLKRNGVDTSNADEVLHHEQCKYVHET